MRSEEINTIFGNQLRVRVMGVLVVEDRILLLNHGGLNACDELWLPPGGGVEVGETLEEALGREFREEVNLEVAVGEFMCMNELIEPPLHALEIFFKVKWVAGKARLGMDPEYAGNQHLKEVRWMTVDHVFELPKNRVHGLLYGIESWHELFAKQGFFKFVNNP